MLWTKQFLHCLCSVRFKKKRKKTQDAEHCRKKKSQNATRTRLREKNYEKYLTMQPTVCSPHNVLVSAATPLMRQGSVASRGRAQRWRPREIQGEIKRVWCVWSHLREQQKQPCCFGPFHRPDCTLHHIALAVSFFSSVHVRRTSTGTHIHSDGAGLQSLHQMSAHMRGSLYSTHVSSSITMCFHRHSCLAVQSLLERTILGSCARSHVLPLDHG